MNEKQIQTEINYLIATRNNLNALIIVLTSGIVSLILTHDVNIIKIILLIIGIAMDYGFLVAYGKTRTRIYKLIGALK